MNTNQKTRLFVLLIAALGLVQLIFSGANWQSFQGRPFLLYAVAAAVASYFGANGSLFHLGETDSSRTSGTGLRGFSLSVPFVLLSMVELSLAEAVLIGCIATAVQTVRSSAFSFVRASFFRLGIAVAVQATVISAAVFALNSLLPRSPISMADGLVVRILAGAGALFVANTLPVAAAVRLEGAQRLGLVWRESFWAFPYYLVSGAVAFLLNQGPSQISPQAALLVAPSLWLAYRYYRTQRAELKSQQQYAHQMATLHLRAIEGLALAVEAKDNANTGGRIRRIQIYSLGVGKAMGLRGTDLEALHAGALLHDIGKLAVPEHILIKTGKLTPEEFTKMKAHPLIGAEIVEQVQFPYPVAPIVRAHHEKWDGSGYPLGLKGEDIPLGARILAAVDCLDSLTSDRELRKRMPLSEAMEYIAAQSGRNFDPKVVEALQSNYLSLDLQARTDQSDHSLSAGMIGVQGTAGPAGLERYVTSRGSANATDFLSSIASARREENMIREIEGSAGVLDIHQMLPRLNDVLSSMIPYDAMAFFVRQGNSLRVEYATGTNRVVLSQLDVALGEGLTGWVARNRQPVVNGNPAVDPGFWCEGQSELNSVLSVPVDGEHELIGVLNLYRREKEAFSRDDLRILNAVTPQAALALANSIKYRDVQRMAKIDPVTNLPNADLFIEGVEEELATSRRLGQPFTILILEMEEYQHVLVRNGKPHTDEILATLSRELQRTCRPQDQVARLGPATFGLALPGMNAQELAVKLERIEQFAKGNRGSFGDLTLFSYGGALFPDDGDTAGQLLMMGRRRAQPSGAAWLASIRALAESVSEATIPVETPEHHPTA